MKTEKNAECIYRRKVLSMVLFSLLIANGIWQVCFYLANGFAWRDFLVIGLSLWIYAFITHSGLKRIPKDLNVEDEHQRIDHCGMFLLIALNIHALVIGLMGDSYLHWFYYYPFILLPFILLDRRQKWKIYAMQTLSIACIFIMEFTLYHLLHKRAACQKVLLDIFCLIFVLVVSHSTNFLQIEGEKRLEKSLCELEILMKMRELQLEKMAKAIRHPINGIMKCCDKMRDKKKAVAEMNSISACSNNIKNILKEIHSFGNSNHPFINSKRATAKYNRKKYNCEINPI